MDESRDQKQNMHACVPRLTSNQKMDVIGSAFVLREGEGFVTGALVIGQSTGKESIGIVS